MSLRFSRSQSLLRSLPSQSSKRSASNVGLLWSLNASHVGQTQLTCGHTRRFKSIYIDALKIGQEPVTGKPTSMSDIEPAKLEIHLREPLKTPPKLSELVFGENFTDHMLTIPWNVVSGWGTPRIVPYGPLALEPSTTVLQYAQTLFEGMKAYRNENDRVTLFRPDMNMKRMNASASRLALPTFDGDALLTLIKELLKVDKHWIPKEQGHSLYIRPTLIGTQRALRVTPPNEALLFVVCAPVGPYYPKGFKPVPLHGTTEFIRAAPGGTGAYKLGANYAPGVMPQKKATSEGYAQNLWLHGSEHHLTEVGTMNMFVVFKRGDTTTLVTPPLDGMILPGVTRDSVLTLARDHASGERPIPGLPSNLVIEERGVTMAEIKSSIEKRELVELFGTGTAAIISPVDRIGYLGEDIDIPVGEDGMGPLSRPFWERLVGIQRGGIESDWNVVVCG
ncbi:branched-chain amino acid aminotransferase II [Thelephora ganbajun]|uniref:Branched-chain amino acid aminotransferase II n=1 Tax=Thelephora ganbajun TaxID=370292 RepID=A0ACB6ZR50_THEGA|nr:branched-chain amino acid aminotransferase II [Thelephora ganbajun]